MIRSIVLDRMSQPDTLPRQRPVRLDRLHETHISSPDSKLPALQKSMRFPSSYVYVTQICDLSKFVSVVHYTNCVHAVRGGLTTSSKLDILTNVHVNVQRATGSEKTTSNGG